MSLSTKCSVNNMDLSCENLNRDRGLNSANLSAAAESSANYAPSVLEPLNPKLKDSDPFEAACGDVSD